MSPPVETKERDLARRRLAVGEAPIDLERMLALMRVGDGFGVDDQQILLEPRVLGRCGTPLRPLMTRMAEIAVMMPLVTASVRMKVIMLIIMSVIVIVIMIMVMVMAFVVVMFVTVMRSGMFRVAMMIPPVPPGHPAGDADDEQAGNDLQIGLGALGRPFRSEIESAQRDDPDDRGVGKGGGEAKQDRLRHGSANGDDERRHHRLRVARLETVQRAEENRARREEPCVSRSDIEDFGQIGHFRLGASSLA